MKSRLFLTIPFLLLMVVTWLTPQAAFAASLTAGNAAELISAINQANSNPDADTILITANITLTAAYENDADYGSTGLPVLSTNITIEGQGYAIQRDESANGFRIMRVSSTGVVTLNNLTVQFGSVTGATASCGDCGGGIYNDGNLHIQHSYVTNNSADGKGGGLYNGVSSSMTRILDSTFNANRADMGGGAANNEGELHLLVSTFEGNSATTFGGGIYNTLSTRMWNSGIRGNGAAMGGGVYNTNVLQVYFSSIWGNGANTASAVYSNTLLYLGSSSVSYNTSYDTGGALLMGNGSQLYLYSSTLYYNFTHGGASGITYQNTAFNEIVNSLVVRLPGSAYPNCDMGTSTTVHTSFSQANDDSCTGFTNSQTTNLLAEADNGGATKTFALDADSSALDAGDTNYCTSVYFADVDQRGSARGLDSIGGVNQPQLGDCDLGAFERGDDIRTFQFATATSTVLEGTTLYNVPVTLDMPLGIGNSQVDGYFWISGGTAEAGVDYEPLGLFNLYLVPGDKISAVPLHLLPGARVGRTIVVSFAAQNGAGLSGPARLGSVRTHTVTIAASTANAAPSRNVYDTHTPVLTWNGISGATGYELQVDTDTNFLPGYVYTNGSIPANTRFLVPGDPLPNGVYYWRVRAKTSTGFTPWSPVERFEILAP